MKCNQKALVRIPKAVDENEHDRAERENGFEYQDLCITIDTNSHLFGCVGGTITDGMCLLKLVS